MNLLYHIKRSNLLYYIKNIPLDILPRYLFRKKLKFWLHQQNSYPKEVIDTRVGYYCKLNQKTPLPKKALLLKDIRKKGNKSVYYYDFMLIGRYFNPNYKVNFLFGDVDKNLSTPTIVKSRPIQNNENSIILKLEKWRHFNFINDTKSFETKKDAIVWRGVIHKENRRILFEKYFGDSNFDIGSSNMKNSKIEWLKPYLSIKKQLDYKFILSIEGIDVATNLKWIMSSNSLCFMPKPKFETWYMEGKLIPNYHYVLIKDDYSDVMEKMEYFSKNHIEAEKILQNAKNWTNQFKDEKLENIISILVLQKFLSLTNES
ncbi:MAG: lipopolysaccharide A protein [Flavobacteriia bacterium]|nr:lipopolysaccharide A protein [Flavobacteriia bacterium]OIP47993.1 MAG: hypothetical protein AUK46_03005 [Flavobacteriaceae bacterium CG2_30_31_66]PIV96150.1 MAG: lipopolysaccharide A protein [Flavobacteriaceae bacterium CG17_big_fil_post_rev_8_21_14_2_50_31_13]PIX12986.1 MAG: lipopolysaccharide A protein [Flavobacteriaceae bacterium CG_4_8_14_3_um_filter_31_8]PIY14367.1 MAG: lipopolysaccharide A protein [Flavobacteriaceae bacterium CG_4_10_14_3_um_filter_31_253]PIZ10454.1 MAG: lipopolysacch